MTNTQNTLICTLACWGLAALAALIAAVLLMLLGDWRLIQALFAAVVIAIILGALLGWIVCRPLPTPAETAFTKEPAAHPVPSSKEAAAAAAAQAREGVEPEPVSPPAQAAERARALVQPSKALPGQAELAARKGEWSYQGGAAAPSPSAAPAAPATAPAPETAPEPAPSPASEAASAPAPAGEKPAGLDGPRDGGADDLKQIKGVGPKLEKLLNSMGYYHFDQVAAWTATEVAWVDENLQGFKGRVSRDNWVDQAKTLAEGGSTAFSDKVKKGDVY